MQALSHWGRNAKKKMNVQKFMEESLGEFQEEILEESMGESQKKSPNSRIISDERN